MEKATGRSLPNSWVMKSDYDVDQLASILRTVVSFVQCSDRKSFKR